MCGTVILYAQDSVKGEKLMKERLARKASKVGVLLNKEKAMLAAESGKLALEVEATKKLEARLADERKKSEASRKLHDGELRQVRAELAESNRLQLEGQRRADADKQAAMQ
ncbi:unnamed protein product, partial [Laminaria digitata]